MIIQDYTKYLTIPYKDLGDSFSGCDCYGLVLLFLENELNIKKERLLDYKSINERKEISRQIDIHRKKYAKVSNISNLIFGDIILFKVFGKYNAHGGVYLGEDRFIHTTEVRGAEVASFADLEWLERFSYGLRVKNAN